MIYQDLRPKKQIVVNYLRQTWPEEVSYLNPAKDRLDIDKLAGLRNVCTGIHCDHDKLHTLLKSQIMSGNIQGAVKVVNGTPDQKFNNWGNVLVSPITVPIFIVMKICEIPERFLKWLARNV